MTQTFTLNELGMEKLLTISDVAKKLRVDDMTVRRWVDKGLVEAVILPRPYGGRRNIRIKASTLNAMLTPTGGK